MIYGVEKGVIFWYIWYIMDNMDMEPLLKSYIRYVMGFVPKERMAYATNNGDRRIIIGSLWLSGKTLYIIETVVNVVLYKRYIQEMMNFEEFCDANNNIPAGILKIPERVA